ncbi:MAG: DUF6356 family protein [Pseudomonadota bacterium]
MSAKSKTVPSRASLFLQGFTAHPASVDETYFQHAGFAASFGLRLAAAAGAAFVHAIVPPLFETTASRIIADLHRKLEARH